MANSVCEEGRNSSGSHSWTSSARTNCYCLVRTGQWTSWTPKNPRRRFLGCTNFLDRNKDCNYRHWIDPELTKYYKELILDLKDYHDHHQSCAHLGKEEVTELEKELEALKLVNLQIGDEKEKLEKKHRKLLEKAREMEITARKGKGREQVLFASIVVLLVLMFAMFMSMSVTSSVHKHMLPY